MSKYQAGGPNSTWAIGDDWRRAGPRENTIFSSRGDLRLLASTWLAR
jgi:hypothetical protein